MRPDRQQLEADLLQFVQARCQHRAVVTPQTDLLEDGLLDSLLLVDLIFQIEDRCGIRLESDHVSPGNFRSVSAIVNLVMNQVETRGDGRRDSGSGAAVSQPAR